MSIRRYLPSCLVALAVVLTLTSVGRADDEKRLERGREILKLWTDGQYKEFVATGDETVR
jgi:hypothetical protein